MLPSLAWLKISGSRQEQLKKCSGLHGLLASACVAALQSMLPPKVKLNKNYPNV